jgi:hypothetical protein
LGFTGIVDVDESVFDLLVPDALLIQSAGEPVVTVEIGMNSMSIWFSAARALLLFQDLGLERSGGDSNEAKRRRIGRSATGLWGSSRKSR